MDSELRKYCKHIVKSHYADVLRTDNETGLKYWDYPACASICRYGQIQARGSSQYYANVKWNCYLRQQIGRLGQLGHGTTLCKYPLGNCAEQHSCNNLSNKTGCNPTILAQIKFTDTVRPRTMQVIPTCPHCKRIFPTL